MRRAKKRQGLRHRRYAVMAAAGTAVLLATAACGSGGSSGSDTQGGGIPKGPIKVGALLTLNGPLAAIGTSQKANDEVLVKVLNDHGGIAGHPVELIALNDQGDPATAVAQAEKLVSEHVAGVIYAGTSATVTQTVPVFMKGKIPVVMLDPLDQWADGNKFPYMFDNYPLNRPTTDGMAEFTKKTLHADKVGVLSDGSSFSDGLLADFKKSVQSSGVTIVKEVSYQPTAADVSTQVRQLKSSGVQAVVLFAASGMGHVYDAMRTLGWAPPIVTTAASFFDGYSEMGALGKSAYANCAVALDKGAQPDSGMKQVLDAVTAKTGVNPSVGQVVLTNDDLLILKAAIEKTNSLNPEKIKAAIEGFRGKSFTTPTIEYSFSESNHAGWPRSQIRMCGMQPLGPYDLPYIAATPS